MSSKRLSPTANLLRTSRFFALPNPLPRPGHNELTSFASVFHSDTATLPHPTHPALATPDSSLSRGDWGLKRNFPLRSTTNSSNPTIRVDAVDTLEHISAFESATDHVMTLKKWHDMNIPIVVAPKPGKRASGPVSEPLKSVFESERHGTESQGRQALQMEQRWKFKGPWLPGMTEGEFKEYVEREINRRKPEFQQYLRKHATDKKLAEKRRQALDNGDDPATIEATPITDAEFEVYVKSLRDDVTATSTLSALINNFLDLPAPPKPPTTMSWSKIDEPSSGALYSRAAPPKTHPSAGLSYLRTSSHIYNHPVLGPQARPPPVEARILEPRKSATGQSTRAKFGVGGVVTDDGLEASFREDSRRMDGATPGLSSFDPSIPGGAKIWVHPKTANIDSQGRIRLSVDRATPSSVNIHKGILEEKKERPQIPRLFNRRMEELVSSPKGSGFKGLIRNNRGPSRGVQNEPQGSDKKVSSFIDELGDLMSKDR